MNLRLMPHLVVGGHKYVCYVCSLSPEDMTTVCGSFHCQPLRLRSCIVSGPLIGPHPPADLIAYSRDPGGGSGCICKCYFTPPSVGVFANAWSHSYINVEH